jgi:hypothetical protein
MRGALALIFLMVMCLALSQGQVTPAPGSQDESRPNLFLTAHFDVIIRVTKHDLGADLVEITALNPEYPPELLRKQVEQLGESLQSAPRGLRITSYRYEGDSGPGQARASFGLVGLVRRDEAKLGLQQITRAFAGAPEPYTVHGLNIQYESEAPDTNILRRYRSDVVELEAQAHPMTGIEYRIVLRSQDPEAIVIPEGQDAHDARNAPPVPPPADGPNWLIIVIIAVASIALGALVYSLLLRPRSTGRKR